MIKEIDVYEKMWNGKTYNMSIGCAAIYRAGKITKIIIPCVSGWDAENRFVVIMNLEKFLEKYSFERII